MKKILHFLITVFTCGTLSAQSILNGDFENWTTTTWQDPTSFISSNDQYIAQYNISPNTVMVNPAYHGNYAVQMTCVQQNNDTIFGYVIDGNPGNGNSVAGGMPYNQKPTGIRLYYKFSCPGSDSALVVLWFKRHDSVIATIPMGVASQSSSFTLFQRSFTVPSTPDTVVFGAATSYSVISNKKGIPGTVFTIDSVTFTGVTSQPANFNGDFETWNNDTLISPQNWSYYGGIVKRTTDAYSLNYAIELVTGVTPNNSQLSSGSATTGTVVQLINHDTVVGGLPFSNQIDTLVFYYKYAPANINDSAMVSMQFKRNAVNIGGAGTFLHAAATYQRVEIPFNIGSVPDSTVIFLWSSVGWPLPAADSGSDLKVDSIHFKSQPNLTAVNKISFMGGLKVYPNPANSQLTIEGPSLQGKDAYLSLYNSTGQCVQVEKLNQGSTIISLNVLPTGMYYYRIEDSQQNNIKADKLLIVH